MAPPVSKGAAVAATSTQLLLRRSVVHAWRALLRLLASMRRRRSHTVRAAGLLGSALASGVASAAALPDDRADLMYHVYDGGGLRASGPAVLVRKKFSDSLSLTGSYYVDMVSNASIDVVTTASPYKETRNEYSLGGDYVVRDATVSVSTSNSKEPDYIAAATSIDVAQEVFGGMTTLTLGYTRGHDKVGRRDVGFFDSATHWRYRFGATQILTPTWLASVNFEAVADEGYLGSPYRAARLLGSTVPENNPRTRSSRAVQFRAIGEVVPGNAVRVDYRYFWDTWGIKAHTTELGYSRTMSDRWLADWYLRYYTQKHALFYSDDAPTQSLYLSRNRQLSTFKTTSLGAKVSYSAKRVPGSYEIKLNGAYELVRSKFNDFTDVRNGKLYQFDANVVQLFVSVIF
ncbi:MAG: DUF3570 domain-containing protein [Rhizobacter sp.]